MPALPAAIIEALSHAHPERDFLLLNASINRKLHHELARLIAANQRYRNCTIFLCIWSNRCDAFGKNSSNHANEKQRNFSNMCSVLLRKSKVPAITFAICFTSPRRFLRHFSPGAKVNTRFNPIETIARRPHTPLVEKIMQQRTNKSWALADSLDRMRKTSNDIGISGTEYISKRADPPDVLS